MQNMINFVMILVRINGFALFVVVIAISFIESRLARKRKKKVDETDEELEQRRATRH